jgi:predicted ArsR family transcriptional regulator
MLDALTTRELTVPDLAKKLGLHRATVRYHMTFLLNQGLVEETRPSEHKGAGRPAMMYRASRHARLPNFPSRNFEMLAQIALRTMAEEIGKERSVEILRSKGVEFGRALIEDAAEKAGIRRWTPEAFQRTVLDGAMRSFGVSSLVVLRDDTSLSFRCFSCPFLEVAERMSDLVCDSLDLGFHEGIDAALGEVRTSRVTCMGHGDSYCEYRMTWAPKVRGKDRSVPIG